MSSSSEPKFQADFRLSITRALGDQLADAIQGLTPSPLDESNIAQLDDSPGVYQLYLNGEFVYVGKADKSVPQRLRQHQQKISGRTNISVEEMSFTCLYVEEDFSAVAPEMLLINKFKKQGEIPWNNNGFGNKDPGRNRDGTILKLNHFDAKYPIDLNFAIPGLEAGEFVAHEFLKRIKAGLPYNFRYDEKSAIKNQEVIVIDEPSISALESFRRVSEVFRQPWQVVALLGYVIMYPHENQKGYESATRYFRNGVILEASPQTLPDDPTTGLANLLG